MNIQPFVDDARELVAELANVHKLPASVIAGRLLHEAQQQKPSSVDELGTLVALKMLCREMGVR